MHLFSLSFPLTLRSVRDSCFTTPLRLPHFPKNTLSSANDYFFAEISLFFSRIFRGPFHYWLPSTELLTKSSALYHIFHFNNFEGSFSIHSFVSLLPLLLALLHSSPFRLLCWVTWSVGRIDE